MKYKIVLFGLIFLAYADNIEARRSGGSSRSSGRGGSSGRSYSSSHTSHTSHSSSPHSSYSPHTSHSTSHTSPDKSASSSLILGERHHSGTQSKPKPSAPVDSPSDSNPLYHFNPSSTSWDKPTFGNSHSDKPAWSNPNIHSGIDFPSFNNPLFNHNPSSTSRDKPAWSYPNSHRETDFPSFNNPLFNHNPSSTSRDKPAGNNPFSGIDLPSYKNPLSTSHSDKPAWSNPYFNPSSSNPPHSTSNADKPAWSNPHFNPSSSNPPYPSNSNIPGSSTSPGGTQGGRHHHPVVSPHRHTNAHSYNSSNSQGTYNPTVTNNHLQQSTSNKTGSGGAFSHPGTYDPSPPYPPFPSSSKPVPYPTGTSSVSQPNSKVSAPYPVGTGSMPQPNPKPPAPYPVGTGTMPQPGHTGNVGFHNSVSQPNYNTMSQPNLGTPHYNPPLSQGYHPSMAQPAFNPHFSQHSYGQPSYGQPSYHPNMAQPAGYYPQPVYQPAPPASGPVIIMAGEQSSGGRGLGQMIAEAAVFSTINAGVNRLINPYPTYHHDYHSGSSTQTSPGTSTTHVTYNNYMNGQPVSPGQMQSGVSAVPGAVPGALASGTLPSGTLPSGVNPALYPGGINNVNTSPTSGGYTPVISGVGTPGNTYSPTGNSGTNVPAPGIVTKVNPDNNSKPPSPPINPLNDSGLVIYGISNAEFWKLTEDLFEKQEFNVSEFIKTNLQNKTNSTEDVAPKPLFEIKKGAFEHPTVRAVRDLFNVFESDSRVKENRTLERRQKENILLDTMMTTDVMNTALSWLTSKRFLDPDDFERKDTLSHIWFNLFDGSSSGFERVFVSETLHTADSAVILGVQDWLSFSHLEEEKRINYAGYVDQIHLGNNSSLLKLNYKMNDLVVSNTTILVGTLPELEMALYTLCFYARPGIECPVSLGGTKFNLYTHMMPYFGKYLIAAAYPSI